SSSTSSSRERRTCARIWGSVSLVGLTPDVARKSEVRWSRSYSEITKSFTMAATPVEIFGAVIRTCSGVVPGCGDVGFAASAADTAAGATGAAKGADGAALGG